MQLHGEEGRGRGRGTGESQDAEVVACSVQSKDLTREFRFISVQRRSTHDARRIDNAVGAYSCGCTAPHRAAHPLRKVDRLHFSRRRGAEVRVCCCSVRLARALMIE